MTSAQVTAAIIESFRLNLFRLRLKTTFHAVGSALDQGSATEDEVVAAHASPLPADPLTPEELERFEQDVPVIATAAWSEITVPLAEACEQIGRIAQIAKLPNAVDADELASILTILPGSPPRQRTLQLACRVEGLAAQVSRVTGEPRNFATPVESNPRLPVLNHDHWKLLEWYSKHTDPALKRDVLPPGCDWSGSSFSDRARALDTHGYLRKDGRKRAITDQGRQALKRYAKMA